MATGIAQLGYLGFEVSDLGAWESFATSVLGLSVSARGEGGAFSLRMDDHAHRIFVEPGPADDLAFVGWQVAGIAEFERVVARLHAAGVDVTLGTPEDEAHRHVKRLARYHDPSGVPSEIYYGPEIAAEPFRSSVVRSGFVAGERGLGHLVIGVDSREESQKFYCDVLGFRVSDRVLCDVHGYQADILFLHTNPRHHSLAFGDKQKKRVYHFMIEAQSMDEVGLAFDRTLRSGLRIMHTLGRHPNDRMFSFYARTPSGFQFEFGWGGRDVDDATWQTTTYDHISEWGHHPPQFLAPPPREKEKPR
jgi:2,3-dihydroxybiphenyl 1,2-dioxygenase